MKIKTLIVMSLLLLSNSLMRLCDASVYRSKGMFSKILPIKDNSTSVARYHDSNTKQVSYREQFIAKIAPIAEQIQLQYKIPASVIIAMSCLESNYGRSELALNAHNFFGIKADKSWDGESYTARTSDLGWVHFADFRRYCSLDQSCQDYAKFLTTKPRYQNAFRYCGTPLKFCSTILADGFCPTPSYLACVSDISDRYSLFKYNSL